MFDTTHSIIFELRNLISWTSRISLSSPAVPISAAPAVPGALHRVRRVRCVRAVHDPTAPA